MPEPTPARVVETHVSYVFLVGDLVYKLKKPVKYGFIDLSTRSAREAVCHREVELNRRLAPDVYLGVLDIVDAEGRAVDHLVKMRRLPDERRLATLVAEGADVSPCVRQVAHDLAAFHAGAATSDEIAEAATWGAVRQSWRRNLDELQLFVGDVLDASVFARVWSRADRYFEGRAPLFSARIEGGHIRDGHGDLLADDIFCLDDGPRILDCIEYNDRFRWADVLCDVAFLAMDLERLGARDLADRFLAWYREFSGESYPQSLADFYVSYRAAIRSKVACLKYQQGDEGARATARELLDLCDLRLDVGRVRLVLVGGLPGTGKSTLASGLSAETGCMVLRSDEVRKDVTAIGHASHPGDEFGEGIYSDAATERTYGELLARVRSLLSHGESVIADASWLRAHHREAARRVALETSSDLLELRCVLPTDVAAERMRHRRSEQNDPSDADATVARAMAERLDPWPEATEVDTMETAEKVCEHVVAGVLGAARRRPR